MNYEDYLREFSKAIAEEIAELRKNGGNKTYLSDGSLLGKKDGKYLYSFTSDAEIRLPDDSPIDLIHQREQYEGILISADGCDIVLALTKRIRAENIAIATLRTEPWYLLEELQKRLTRTRTFPTANRALAEALLTGISLPSLRHRYSFQNFLPRIETQLNTSISYNTHQDEAVTHVLQEPISFIWGPPGTGKTKTLGMTVASLVHAGESVLVVAHSNAAVDTAMKSVAQFLCQASYYKDGRILRFGISTPGSLNDYALIDVRGIIYQQEPDLVQSIRNLEKQRKELARQSRASELTTEKRESLKEQLSQIKAELQPLKEQLKKQESELVKQATVVGCTFSKATIAQEVFDRQFDAVIIDEASMAYIPHCTFVSTLARYRIGIFGDFRQLGPVSQGKTSAVKEWLQRDIFDEAGITAQVTAGRNDDRMVLLKTQYRMHPEIADIPNKLFYGDQLKNGEGVIGKTETARNLAPDPGHALVFYDLSQAGSHCLRDQESHSRFNVISALLSADLAYRAEKEQEGIGIITPYNAQSRLIHRLIQDAKLSKTKAATVHRFQGSEQSLIIFDAVDTAPQRRPGKLLQGGMQSTAMRLANVAISRAQGKFISLIDYRFFKDKQDSFSTFYRFLTRLRSSSKLVPVSLDEQSNIAPWEFELPGVTCYPDAASARSHINDELQQAKVDIAIDWSTNVSSLQHFTLDSFQRENSSRVKIFLRGSQSENISRGLRNVHRWCNNSASKMGIVGIDRCTLWLYLNPEDADAPVIQIKLPQTVKLLHSLLNLVPDRDPGAIEHKILEGKAPLGSCPICNTALWYECNTYGVHIHCPKHAYHPKRKLNEKDATLLAGFMKKTCPCCNSALQGRKSGKDLKIFLGCTQRNCRGTVRLEDVL